MNIKREIKSYKFNLTPMTPIQIGNGNQLYPYDYVIKDGKYYRIEVSEFIQKLPTNERNQFMKLLESTASGRENAIKIRSFISENYKEEYGYLYKGKAGEEVKNKYQDKIGGAKHSNEENQLIIEEFIGTHKGKYIPGSTIKGAIRGAFLFGEFDKSIHRYKIKREEKTQYGKPNKTAPYKLVDRDDKFITRNNEIKKEGDSREASILGLTRLEPKFDPFKHLIVTDTKVYSDLTKIENIKRISINPKKQDMPMGSYEILTSVLNDKITHELEFNITLKEDMIDEEILITLSKDRNGNSMIKEIVPLYMDMLLEKLNFKASLMLEKDLKFFEKINHKQGIGVCKSLLDTLENLKENEALIRFGRGAGFDSTTFNLANTNEGIGTKVVCNGSPVGWAIITCQNQDW